LPDKAGFVGEGRGRHRRGLRLVRGGFFQKPSLAAFCRSSLPVKAGFAGVGRG